MTRQPLAVQHLGVSPARILCYNIHTDKTQNIPGIILTSAVIPAGAAKQPRGEISPAADQDNSIIMNLNKKEP